MGLSLPHELTVPMGWIGLTWPEADEDLLKDAGQKWIDFGNQLSRVAEPANSTARQVWSGTEGAGADAFQSWWTEEEGPQRRLSDDAKAALLIGGALLAFAAITLTVKLSIIAQLVILAAEIAQAIATAFVTFGATTAEIPGFIVASRVLIRRLLDTLIDHVQSVIREVMEQARRLLRGGSRMAGRRADNVAKNVVSVPGRQTEPRYSGKPMLMKYRYETDAAHPKNGFGSSVRRLSDTEREHHRIFVDDQGLLRNAHDRSLFDTTGATSFHSPSGGKAIFVQDEAGNIYASQYQRVGEFHHSTLSNGDPVAAAGEIMATNGRLDGVTAASGHYRPEPHQMQQFVDEMGRHGITDVPVYDFNGVNRWN